MIYKVGLTPGEVRRIEGSPLHVNSQHGRWQIWYIVEPVLYDVTVVGTGPGSDFVNNWKYMNTFMELNGELVWHAFKLKR